MLQHSLLIHDNLRALTLFSNWHNLRLLFYILCITVCVEMFDVDPSHINFGLYLLISQIAFLGVLITLDIYIEGASARLFRTVFFSFKDSFLIFNIFKHGFKSYDFLVEIVFIIIHIIIYNHYS